ncbi:acyltransferase family protein [Burkholderia plantarii]|uniref:acyltransferase family protein n=1 Tax=Burkholderia plantarii TaxID=41899 RepID=UPI0009F5E303|nr:acyltransferase [Burkholderia plantarii]
MSSLPRSTRLDHVDAMRAVAVILVMWTHYAELYAHIAGSQFALDGVQRSINFGRIGVVIFFGISGMLIPSSLHGSPLGGAWRFVIRRVCRLYPAFWLSLPIGYAAYWLLSGNRLPVADLLANLTMVPTALGHVAVMPHYWTLETELVFYVLCLALHLSGGLHRMCNLCLICLGLCAAFAIASAWKLIPADALGQYRGMPYHLAIMFWGACFRQAYDAPFASVRFGLPGAAVSMSNREAFSIVTTAVVGIAALMAAVDLYRQDPVHVAASLGYLFGIVAFLLLATVLRIRARSFAWLGEISYSVYLLHGVPLYLLYGFCKSHGLTGGPLALYMALTVPPALALSWASHRLVETAGIRAGHRLTDGGARSLRRPATGAAAAASTAVASGGTARPAPIGGDDA